MIISHEHRYVYIEVPHTGTSSIRRVLIEHYGGEPFLRRHANYTEFRQVATSPAGVRLISHEQFTSVPELPVEYVPAAQRVPGGLL